MDVARKCRRHASLENTERISNAHGDVGVLFYALGARCPHARSFRSNPDSNERSGLRSSGWLWVPRLCGESLVDRWRIRRFGPYITRGCLDRRHECGMQRVHYGENQ